MERRTRVKSIKRKPYQFARRGIVIKRLPKAGYVMAKFDGDEHNTPMRISDLRIVGQTTMVGLLEEVEI